MESKYEKSPLFKGLSIFRLVRAIGTLHPQSQIYKILSEKQKKTFPKKKRFHIHKMRLSVRSLISEKRSSGLLYLLLFSHLSLFLHILFNQGCDYPRWGGIMDVHEQSRIFFQGDNHRLLARFLYISDRFTIL